MIAASEPQEFIPSGRQQVQIHPGPLDLLTREPLVSKDDFLLNKFEKVSITDTKETERWYLRKAPNNFLKTEAFCEDIDKNETNSKGHSPLGEDVMENSLSFKSAENISYKLGTKRGSDSFTPRITKKRMSGENDTRNDSKTTCGSQLNACKSAKIHTKPETGYMEDELYINGKIVVWSRGLLNNADNLDNGRTVLCCYTSQFPIKHAIWCTFYKQRPTFDCDLLETQGKREEPDGLPVPSVCIVDSLSMNFYSPKGEDFGIAIPFQINNVWNTKFGIFIEKENDDDVKEGFYESKATLYSLAYPLDDICPVAMSTSSSVMPQLVNSTFLEIVFTNEDPNICMIYDTHSKQHSVYRIRKLKYEERMEFYDKADSVCTSNASTSSKLKSRLSMWENVKNSNQISTPNLIPSPKIKLSNIMNISNTQHSKSHSSMAAISRCQSPAASSTGSPWLLRSNSRLDSLNHPQDSSYSSSVSKQFFDCSKSMSHLRTAPSICLDHLWTDQYNSSDGSPMSAATKVFLSEDLTGQWYLCYIIQSKHQLSIVRIDFTNTSHIIFGMVTSISARDAVAIPHLRMLAILEYNGNLTLYSGLGVVGKLHIGGTLVQHTPSPYMKRTFPQFNSPFPRRSSLLPHCSQDPKFDDHLLSPVLPALTNVLARTSNILQLTFPPEEPPKAVLKGLRDAIEDRLTLQYSDGTCYRITLPSLTSSLIVESCLSALRCCLQRDATLTLMTRWYSTRNTIGTENMTSEQEWNMFVALLLELLGYEEEQISDNMKDPPTTPSSKRIRTSTSGSSEDWKSLLNSHYCKNDVHPLDTLKLSMGEEVSHKSSSAVETQINTSAVLFPYIRLIHYTLHLLYEDLKMNTLRSEDLEPLCELLNKLVNDIGLQEYALHYWKDFPAVCKVGGKSLVSPNDLSNTNSWVVITEKPLSIYEHIDSLLKGILVPPYPYLKNVNLRSRNLVQLCGLLASDNQSSCNFNVELLINNIVPSVIIPDVCLKETRKYKNCNSNVKQAILLMTQMKITPRYLDSLPVGIYLLLYGALWKCREKPPTNWPPEAYYLLWRDDLAAHALKFEQRMAPDADIVPTIKQGEVDQQDGMDDVNSQLMKLRFPDDVRVQEVRKMLQSSKPVPIVLVQRPDVSDHDFIDEQEKHLFAICTRTMALPIGRGMFTLRTATPVVTEPLPAPPLCLTGKAPPKGTTVELTHIDTPANMSLWPLFHNGVANGLRVNPDAHNIDNTWITFNKPGSTPRNDQQMEHAGFLMALGLNGHLRNLANLNTFDYLMKIHEMTSVGILLGLAAAFRGTAHSGFTKTLSIHVEALLPPTSMEIDVPQNLQVASLLGIGLLYQGTAHRHMTEVLLSEIGRPPGPEMENSLDRESYSLAAGLALGLVTLKQGGKLSGLSDLNVTDTLHYYMVGGNKRPFTGSQKDKYKVSSFQIREGSSVNLDVTAPGATLALGLMYMGSGNKAVADWMCSPETQYLLDFVRPDFLMLRILSKGLILWNDIIPSKEWIEEQVPATIRPYCMVKPCPTLNIDYEAMNQAYCNIITGACFALGLKYAGSADEEAFQTLLHFCHLFTSLTAKSIAELAGRPTIETCLNVLLLSAAMVMAGTGNLEIMRLVRHLRRRVGVASSSVVTYGSHLATHMALGLLFLGGGRYSLSNSPASVAALICAFYPKFPTHSNDNRYHLQAFRHLYVLAAEMRLVIPKEVQLDKICYANLSIVKLDGTKLSIRCPDIIPDINTLARVSVDDERYRPVVFKRNRNWDILEKILKTTGYIEVKQRAGCLSYIADKFGYHSQLARTLTRSETVPWDPPSSSIVAFTSVQAIKHFCDLFLTAEGKSESDLLETRMSQVLTRVTYDAVIKDKIIVVPVFAAMVKLINDLETSPSTLDFWQFKLICTQVLDKSFSCNLLSTETVLSLKQEITVIMDLWDTTLSDAVKTYLHGGDLGGFEKDIIMKLALYVLNYDLPFKSALTGTSVLQVLYNLKSSNNTDFCNKVMKFM